MSPLPSALRKYEDDLLAGELIGDDDCFEDSLEFIDDYEPVESPSSSPSTSPTTTSSLPPPPHPSAPLSGLRVDTGDQKYVLSKQVPGPSAVVWSLMPQGMIADSLDEGNLEMDDAIMVARKAAFRSLVVTFISALVTFVESKGPLVPGSNSSPVTCFVATFLFAVDKNFLVDIICKVVVPPAQYILMDPEFSPEQLLRLPRISKEDYNWGCYMDILTTSTQKVAAWYTGSACGWGGKYRASGLIGRVLSYYNSHDKLDQMIMHDKWIHGLEGKDTQANFRKIADFGAHPSLHRVYVYFVESLMMTLTSFDVNYDPPANKHYLCRSIPPWVKELRKQLGVRVFTDVKDLNFGYPLRQGIPKDGRFGKNEAIVCSNPDAKCPNRKSDRWHPLVQGQTFSSCDKLLCNICHVYRRNNEKHRPQPVVDFHEAHRNENKSSMCWWCFKPWALSGRCLHNFAPAIQAQLCKPCYHRWKGHKNLVPIIGTHIPADHVFRCEGAGCGTTVSQKWFFETYPSHEGYVQCAKCHCIPIEEGGVIATRKNAKEAMQRVEKAAKPPHTVGNGDIEHLQIDGFHLYCLRHFGFDFKKGRPEEDSAKEAKRIVQGLDGLRSERLFEAQQQEQQVQRSSHFRCSNCAAEAKRANCDKILPSCTQCVEKGLDCQYPPSKGTNLKRARDDTDDDRPTSKSRI